MRVIEWLNANAYRNYPFIEDANLKLIGGRVLPQNALLDAHISVFDARPRDTVLTQFAVGSSTVVFTFAFTDGLVTPTTFTVTVPINVAVPYSYAYIKNDNAGWYSVRMQFGAGIAELASWPQNTYVAVSPIKLEPAVTQHMPRHVLRSIKGGAGPKLDSGPVFLREGYNCTITTTNGGITISAVYGGGKGVYCGTEAPVDGVTFCSNLLLALNGMHGDNTGSIVLAGGPGIVIEPDADDPHTLNVKTNLPSEAITCG